jgi:hypothetical protein
MSFVKRSPNHDEQYHCHLGFIARIYLHATEEARQLLIEEGFTNHLIDAHAQSQDHESLVSAPCSIANLTSSKGAETVETQANEAPISLEEGSYVAFRLE